MILKIDGVTHELDVNKAKETGVLSRLSDNENYPTWDEINGQENSRLFKSIAVFNNNELLFSEILALNKVMTMHTEWLKHSKDKSREYYIGLYHGTKIKIYDRDTIPCEVLEKAFPLSFPTYEMAERFLIEFEPDIHKCLKFVV